MMVTGGDMFMQQTFTRWITVTIYTPTAALEAQDQAKSFDPCIYCDSQNRIGFKLLAKFKFIQNISQLNITLW